MTNYILKYWDKINSGDIIVGKRIKQQMEKLVDDLHNPKDPYVFDIELATKPIEFVETMCVQAQGSSIGEPLKLELFQKARWQAMFGFVHKDTRLRQYKETMTIIGRKNGKTTENSALALYMMIGDGEGSAECYFVATKKDQANIAFEESHKMVQQSSVLNRYVRKRQSDLYFEPTYSTLQSLAGESNSLDGLNSHFVVIDELAAVKDRNLYDVMAQSTSSREQAMINSISTNGFVRDSIYDSQYDYACRVLDGEVDDHRFLAFLYEMDHRDEWKDEDMWIKANPGLDTIKRREELKSFVERAKVDSSFRPTVLTKDFNITSTDSTAWLDMGTIENEQTFDLKDMGFKYAIGGIDMSETTDLTSAGILLQRPGDDTIYYESMFWLPTHRIEERSEEDSVPYDLFERQGLLRGSGGYKIDPHDVMKWFVEIQEKYGINILWIGYDRWGLTGVLDDFKGQFGQESMIPVIQGARTLSVPMKELEGDLDAKLINYNDNNLLKMNLANTVIRTDDNGNIRPIKGRDRRRRIDGTIALLCAYTVFMEEKSNYYNLI